MRISCQRLRRYLQHINKVVYEIKGDVVELSVRARSKKGKIVREKFVFIPS